jgi:hypothetical protein
MKKIIAFQILFWVAILIPYHNINAEVACPDGQQILNETDGCVPIVPAETASQPSTQNQQTSGFVALASIPGLTEGIEANTAGLAKFFNNLYKFAIGMAATLAVIMIIWEGVRIATNQDNVSIITDSKGKILNAILGLVLVLSPVLVFTIINPSILNLSINLPELDTKSTVSVDSGSVVIGTRKQVVGNDIIVTKGYLANCTTTDCAKEIQNCRDTSESYIRNPSYYRIVCANTDGRSISPNAPDSSWFSRARSCPDANQNLAVYCIANTNK